MWIVIGKMIHVNRSYRPLPRGKWVAENPRLFYVIAGATYVYFPSWTTIQMELVDRTLPHRNFNFSNMHHDIGLFRVTIMCIYKLYVENKINKKEIKKDRKGKGYEVLIRKILKLYLIFFLSIFFSFCVYIRAMLFLESNFEIYWNFSKKYHERRKKEIWISWR